MQQSGWYLKNELIRKNIHSTNKYYLHAEKGEESIH